MRKMIMKYFPRLYYRVKDFYWDHASSHKKEEHLKKIYKIKTGHELDLNNPKRYTEKTQLFKLYGSNEFVTRLCDKYLVREWVAEKIGSEYLIPLLGVWEDAYDIDFDKLPTSFVLKTNHGSGTVILVRDKNELNIEETRKTLNNWLKMNFAYSNVFEMQYYNISPLIIAEKMMVDSVDEDLPDYKFFCFDGKVFCSYTTIDYIFDHKKAKLGYFDREYNLLPYYRTDYEPITTQLEKPDNYWDMVKIAEILSEGFSHVRVDLYNKNGKIFFGEMTFTTDSGFTKFQPDKFDYILGEKWNLNIERN